VLIEGVSVLNAAATFPLSIAGLTIDPVRRHVAGPGGDEALQPLVMQLLIQLVSRPGEVFPRRELFDHLWGNAQVGDDSLNRLVAELRKVLDRTSEGAVLVETVPRMGYRLVAEQAETPDRAPFARRSVIAGGGALLLSLGTAGLWRARNERLDQVKRLTDRGDMLLRDAPPMEAGEALLPLRQALDLDSGNVRALGLLALAEETRAFNGGSSDAAETLRIAEKAARSALQRDAAEPHARLAMLDLKAGSLSWSQMEDELESLRRSVPANLHVLGSLSSFLQAAGRTSRSWFYNEQAAALAPASPTPLWRRALRLWTAGRTDEALALTERLMPLWPTHALVWNARFMILAFSGRAAAAEAMMRDTVGPRGNAHPARPAQWLPTLEAFADASPARIAEARDANLAAARLNPAQAAYAAMALAQLGEVDAAFEVIDGLLLSKGPLVANRPIVPRSFTANSPSWCRTQWLFMPPLASVREDPRFEELCEGLGLAQYWRERRVRPDTRI
jgi:DNA-binding winged helix-turn-helix (wHTH) protein/tetratricopeptide (TPR) repeat protein